jgi:hypothetical protein
MPIVASRRVDPFLDRHQTGFSPDIDISLLRYVARPGVTRVVMLSSRTTAARYH